MKTKEKILEVSVKEFAKIGYDGLSMNNIANYVGINKATLYHHFKNKETLYKEVMRIEIDKLYSNYEKELDFEKQSGKELFINYIKAFIKTIKENPYIISFALREFANYGANIHKSLIPHIEHDINTLEKIVKKLNIKRKYKNTHIYTIYCLIHGTINTFYSIQMCTIPIVNDFEFKQNSEKSLDYISAHISEILLDALI